MAYISGATKELSTDENSLIIKFLISNSLTARELEYPERATFKLNDNIYSFIIKKQQG
ncbi:UNVERIFIED_CONTAM: hypothetical protein O8I53_10650 [Campylobacter lari]